MTSLQTAIEQGQALGKAAVYFGAWGIPGHYLHQPNGRALYDRRKLFPDLYWTDSLMDGGLLKNGKHLDIYDGKVFWTCGGLTFWYAFFWWDRSCDTRGASNSGFYVRGFGWPEAQAAFEYACQQFPAIVARQKHPLTLQENAHARC